MLFNSVEYLLFLPTVVVCYFSTQYRWRWLLLLGTSYLFYAAWRVEYTLLLIISTLINYTIALQFSHDLSMLQRRLLLAGSLFFNLGLLFIFKYFNFFSLSLHFFYTDLGIYHEPFIIDLLLPLGISFYTFQTLGYIIDVYRGTINPEKHLGYFALYVVFFPQLVAGPIERASQLLPQFFENHTPNYELTVDGLLLILWGTLKKVVIADRLALYVDQVFNNPTDYYGFAVLLAVYFFAIQIYCDFSGYSDIAIGSAKLLGFRLQDNFQQPYFATSIVEFWQRWHISLSSWFRDYLYIPLGGNRVSKARWYRNLLVVFIVSGFWHGAEWNFIIWGLLHGLYYIGFRLTASIRVKLIAIFRLVEHPKLLKFLSIFVTFHLITFAWFFFRADVVDAIFMIRNSATFNGSLTQIFTIVTWPDLVTALMLVILLGIVDAVQTQQSIRYYLVTKPVWVRWIAYAAAVLIILNLSIPTNIPFIYFQF